MGSNFLFTSTPGKLSPSPASCFLFVFSSFLFEPRRIVADQVGFFEDFCGVSLVVLTQFCFLLPLHDLWTNLKLQTLVSLWSSLRIFYAFPYEWFSIYNVR